jgi:hypothetical protein
MEKMNNDDNFAPAIEKTAELSIILTQEPDGTIRITGIKHISIFTLVFEGISNTETFETIKTELIGRKFYPSGNNTKQDSNPKNREDKTYFEGMILPIGC